MSNTSNLISRMMLALRAGLQFNGARDLYAVYGYSRNLTEGMLYEKYKRQDIASTIIDKPADALWTAPPQILSQEGFTKSWNTFAGSIDIWTPILRADKLLGMEKYVVLFLGLPGNPETAFTGRAKKPTFVRVYGGSCAKILTYFKDPSKDNFGMPEFYQLSLNTENGLTGSQNSIKVHSSRIVHLTNELLDSNLVSQPRLVKGFNTLEDIMKVAGGSAETYWLTANRGMQVDVDKDMELGTEDAKDLAAEIDEFQHQLRRVIRTRGVKIETLGSEVADPKGVFTAQIALLATTYRIPQRILLGAEAGQLASEQDRANWAISVSERRKSFAEPYILRPLIARLGALGILEVPTQEIVFKWPEAFKVSPLERAQTMAQTARAIVNISRQAQYGHPIVTTEEGRHVIGLEPNNELPTIQDALEFVAEPDRKVGYTDPEEEEDKEDEDLSEDESHSAKGISNPPDQGTET